MYNLPERYPTEAPLFMVAAQSSQAQLDLVYYGPDVESGSMEVRDLAPAMLAMASLFEAAATQANGDRAKVNINLKSTSTNSFHLGLEILNSVGGPQGVMDAVLYTAADLKEILFGVGGAGAGGGGLWWVISKMRNRKPDAVEPRGDNVNVTINAEEFNVSHIVYNLYEDGKVRKATEDIAHLVKTSDGIDAVEVQENGESLQRIDKANVSDFDFTVPETITDSTERKVFNIVNLAFKENNKWRVSDGTTTYMASVEDADFLAKIDRNEIAFSKNGRLVCQFRTTQRLTTTGIKSEYRIIEVERYTPASQLNLPMNPPDTEE